MSSHEVHVNFAGKIVMVGFRQHRTGVLPLILRHIGTSADRITIVTAEDAGRAEANHFGGQVREDRADARQLPAHARAAARGGGFPVNLSVDVSSVALVELARERGALYLDTCVEPWAGGYTDSKLSVDNAQQLHHAARRARAARRGRKRANRRAHAWRESRSGVAPGPSRRCSTSPRICGWRSRLRRAASNGRNSHNRSASR